MVKESFRGALFMYYRLLLKASWVQKESSLWFSLKGRLALRWSQTWIMPKWQHLLLRKVNYAEYSALVTNPPTKKLINSELFFPKYIQMHKALSGNCPTRLGTFYPHPPQQYSCSKRLQPFSLIMENLFSIILKDYLVTWTDSYPIDSQLNRYKKKFSFST